MATLRTSNSSLSFITRLFVFSFIVGLVSCSTNHEYNEYGPLTREELAKVKTKFYEEHHFRHMKEPHRQEIIDAIAGRKNFTFQYEKSYFRNTLHSNFPLTVEHEVWFYNPSTPEHDNALLFELYLYDLKRQVWLPISHIKAVWDNSKTLSREKASLWDEKNNWVELYREDISPEHEFDRLMERVRSEDEHQIKREEE